MQSNNLLDGGSWVTDGGLETDLLFNRGVDLPEFASFPLVQDAQGAAMLKSYYAEYAAIAIAADAGRSSRRPPGGPTRTGARSSATTRTSSTRPTAPPLRSHAASRTRRAFAKPGQWERRPARRRICRGRRRRG